MYAAKKQYFGLRPQIMIAKQSRWQNIETECKTSHRMPNIRPVGVINHSIGDISCHSGVHRSRGVNWLKKQQLWLPLKNGKIKFFTLLHLNTATSSAPAFVLSVGILP